MLEKTIIIGDTPVKLQATSYSLQIFEDEFKVDALTIIFTVSNAETLGDITKRPEGSEDVDNVKPDAVARMTKFGKQLLWAFAKAADDSIGNYREWLRDGGFQEHELLEASHEALDLYRENISPTGSNDKKKAVDKMKAIQAARK